MVVLFDKAYLAEMGNLGYPYTPTHPGEILKEEIECRGLSQKELARQMEMSYTMLNEILNAKRPVTASVALMFEASLGIEAEMLMNMQTRYNMQLARKDKKLVKRFEKIRKTLPSNAASGNSSSTE